MKQYADDIKEEKPEIEKEKYNLLFTYLKNSIILLYVS